MEGNAWVDIPASVATMPAIEVFVAGTVDVGVFLVVKGLLACSTFHDTPKTRLNGPNFESYAKEAYPYP